MPIRIMPELEEEVHDGPGFLEESLVEIGLVGPGVWIFAFREVGTFLLESCECYSVFVAECKLAVVRSPEEDTQSLLRLTYAGVRPKSSR